MKKSKISIYLFLAVIFFSCDSSTQPEGCDGISGSDLEFDECGVCGGTGVLWDEESPGGGVTNASYGCGRGNS